MHVDATSASTSTTIARTPSIAAGATRSERLLPAVNDRYDGDTRLALSAEHHGKASPGKDERWLQRVGDGNSQGEAYGHDKKAPTQTLTATLLQTYHPPPEADEETRLSSNRTSVVVVSWASHDSRVENHEASSAAHATESERSRDRGAGWALFFGADQFDATRASDVRSHLLDNEPAGQRAC